MFAPDVAVAWAFGVLLLFGVLAALKYWWHHWW